MTFYKRNNEGFVRGVKYATELDYIFYLPFYARNEFRPLSVGKL